MSEAGGSNSVPATSIGEPTELQSIADRVASGLNLLSLALITFVVSRVLVVVGQALTERVLLGNWGWGMLVLHAIAWAVWPLALISIVRIVQVRAWSVPRWLLALLVAYIAARCVWTPVMSSGDAVSWIGADDDPVPLIDIVWAAITWLLALLYFAVLFGGFHLSGAVDACFDGSLISERHRAWLLWLGVVLHSMLLVWWVAWRIWDTRLPADWRQTNEDLCGVLITTQLLTVSLPFLAWLIWLFVVALRIGRKLRRFAKRGRCPRCDYYLHDAPSGGGCPECGWMRPSEQEGGPEAV